jgi:riboflavin kinase/FMN adenylyltransferase
MQTIHITYPHDFAINDLPETIAAIGFFDGIHQGHQGVIQEAIKKAQAEKKESAVISFYPHPSVVLKQSNEKVHYITPIEEKEAILSGLGVDRLYLINFNKELSLLSPKIFIDHFIIGLHITHLVAGFDFSFGHKGTGNMKNISSFSENHFTTTEVEGITYQGEKVSSTSIRKALQTGAVEQVTPLLGRHYQTVGTVVKGDQRGRKLGFPTANLEIDDDKLLPKQGVYAVKVDYNGTLYTGMANLGVKPTFKTGVLQPSVEVYIFNFDRDIYGEELTVYWYQYIRAEKKFNGIEEIIKQLQADEKATRQYFSSFSS